MKSKSLDTGRSEPDGMTNPGLMSGTEAALRTISAALTSVSVCSDTINNGISFGIAELQDRLLLKPDPVGAIAYAAGLASTGNPAGVFIESTRFSGVSDQVSAAAARHLPLTIVISEPLSSAAHLATTGAQNSLALITEAGCPVLVASSVQELADFIVVAGVVSQEVMLPVLVYADGRECAWSFQEVDLPPVEGIGLPDDESSSLSLYRSMLFGHRAAGDNSWIDTTRPLGIGTRLPDELALKIRTGRHVFVKSEFPSLFEKAFSAFADKTGRAYSAVTATGMKGADVVLLASGSVVDRLQRVLNRLPSRGPSIGILNVSQLRPFPVESVATELRNVTSVGVFVSTSSDNLDDLALVRDVRASLQVFSGVESKPGGKRRRNKSSQPDQRTIARPVLYPAGWNPTESEILALIRRLSEKHQSTGPLVLGARLSSTGIRAPEIERIGQRMAAHSIDFEDYEIIPGDLTESNGPAGVFVIAQQARETWRLLEQASRLLKAAGVDGIQASLHRVSDATTRPAIGQISWETASVPFVLVTRPSLLGALDVSRMFPDNARVIVGIPDSENGKIALERHFPSWLSEKDANVLEVRLPDEIWAERRIDEIQCLLAALVGEHPALKTAALESIAGSGVFSVLEADELRELLERLNEHRTPVEVSSLLSEEELLPEDQSPADVVQFPSTDTPLADLDRFWKTTGYLYRKGRLQDVPVDPFLTSAALPARAGALTTHSLEAESIPRVIQELCTGCGACWTVCPESALGVQLCSVESLFDSAMESATGSGGAFVHVPRLKPAVVRTIHKLVSKDDLHQYLTAESLITEAFRRVLEKAGLNDEKQAQVQQEIQLLLEPITGLRPVRTQLYFERAEDEAKGSGLLLNLAADPDACTSCGLCYAVCDEDAIEPNPVSIEGFNPAREWKVCDDLRVPQLSHVSGDAITPPEYLPALLAGSTTSRVFRAGGADFGNLNRTVLKLFLESQNALSGPRLADLVDRLKDMIGRIDGRLQEQVHSALEINDFEAFASSLGEMSGKLNTEKLTQLTAGGSSEKADRAVDADPLAHLARLRGVLSDWLARLAPDGTTSARPHMVLATAMTERSFGLACYPINPFAMPCFTAPTERVSDLVDGLFDGIQEQYRSILDSLDTADRVLEDVYDPSQDASVEDHRIREISPSVLLVTDRFESDTARLLASGKSVKILIVSGGASVVDSGSNVPDLVRLALAIDDVYVHQLSAVSPIDLLTSLRRGLAHTGPALFHVYSPDSVRDGIESDQALAVTQMATTSGVFPEILRVPGSAVQIKVEDSAETRPVEWLLAQDRFAEHFRFIRKSEWSSGQISISEWLALESEDRPGKEAYVERTLSNGRTQRFLAGSFATDFEQKCRASWNHWMSVASSNKHGESHTAGETASSFESASQGPAEPAQTVVTVDVDALQTLSDRLLEMSGFNSDGESLDAWLADIQRGKES